MVLLCVWGLWENSFIRSYEEKKGKEGFLFLRS